MKLMDAIKHLQSGNYIRPTHWKEGHFIRLVGDRLINQDFVDVSDTTLNFNQEFESVDKPQNNFLKALMALQTDERVTKIFRLTAHWYVSKDLVLTNAADKKKLNCQDMGMAHIRETDWVIE